MQALGLPTSPWPRLGLQLRLRQLGSSIGGGGGGGGENIPLSTGSCVLSLPADGQDMSSDLELILELSSSSSLLTMELWLQVQSNSRAPSQGDEALLLAELRVVEEVFPFRAMLSLSTEPGLAEPVLFSVPLELHEGDVLAKLELCISPATKCPEKTSWASLGKTESQTLPMLELTNEKKRPDKEPSGDQTTSSFSVGVCEVWFSRSLCFDLQNIEGAEDLSFYVEVAERGLSQRRRAMPAEVIPMGTGWLRLRFTSEWLLTDCKTGSSFDLIVFGVAHALGSSHCALATGSLEPQDESKTFHWVFLSSGPAALSGPQACGRMLLAQHRGSPNDPKGQLWPHFRDMQLPPSARCYLSEVLRHSDANFIAMGLLDGTYTDPSGLLPAMSVGSALDALGVTNASLPDSWEHWTHHYNQFDWAWCGTQSFDCVAFAGDMLNFGTRIAERDDGNKSPRDETRYVPASPLQEPLRGSQSGEFSVRGSRSLEAPAAILEITHALHLPLVHGKCPNTFISYSWQISGGEDLVRSFGQTEVIYMTTCPAWDHRATIPLPLVAGGQKLSYPASLEEVSLKLDVWHVEALRGTQQDVTARGPKLLVGSALVPLAPLLRGFEELDGYFHISSASECTSDEDSARGQLRLKLRASWASFCSARSEKSEELRLSRDPRDSMDLSDSKPATTEALNVLSDFILENISSTQPLADLITPTAMTSALQASELGFGSESLAKSHVSVVSDGSLSDRHAEVSPERPSQEEEDLADPAQLETAREAFQKNLDELLGLQKNLLSRFDGNGSNSVEESQQIENAVTLGGDQSLRQSREALAELLHLEPVTWPAQMEDHPANPLILVSGKEASLSVAGEGDSQEPDEPEPAAEEMATEAEAEQSMEVSRETDADEVQLEAVQSPEHKMPQTAAAPFQGAGAPPTRQRPQDTTSLAEVNTESVRYMGSAIQMAAAPAVEAVEELASSSRRRQEGGRGPLPVSLSSAPEAVKAVEPKAGEMPRTAAGPTRREPVQEGSGQRAGESTWDESTTQTPWQAEAQEELPSESPVKAATANESLQATLADASCQTIAIFPAVSQGGSAEHGSTKRELRGAQAFLSTPAPVAKNPYVSPAKQGEASVRSINWDTAAAALSGKRSPASSLPWTPSPLSEFLSPADEASSMATTVLPEAEAKRPTKWLRFEEPIKQRPKWLESDVETKRLARIMRGAAKECHSEDSDGWSSG